MGRAFARTTQVQLAVEQYLSQVLVPGLQRTWGLEPMTLLLDSSSATEQTREGGTNVKSNKVAGTVLRTWQFLFFFF